MLQGLRKASPAMVVAVVALFIALSGSAFAVGSKAVPRAKVADVALVANNAKKLGGKTSAQVASTPGPANSAAGLVSTKTGTFSLPVNGPQFTPADFTLSCDAGEKALGGGYSTQRGDQAVILIGSSPNADGVSWTVRLWNVSIAGPATGTVYVLCLK
jgi:hypothetical protein